MIPSNSYATVMTLACKLVPFRRSRRPARCAADFESSQAAAMRGAICVANTERKRSAAWAFVAAARSSVTDLFWIFGSLFLLLMLSVWFGKRPVGAAPVGGH